MHRIICGDVTSGAVRSLMRGQRAALVYSDPPWGQGNLQYWRTYNGESITPNWTTFLQSFVSAVVQHCDGPALIEMGLRWSDQLSKEFSEHGWREWWRVVVRYGSKKTPKNVLMITRADAKPPESFTVPAGNEWVVNRAMAAKYAIGGGIVLDPCLGLGRSAKCFADRGMWVYGCEINARRLTQAAKRLNTTIQEQ